MMNYDQKSIEEHKKHQGKLEIITKIPVTNRDELSLAYTPGVGAVSSAIANNKELAKSLTMAGRCVLVVSDGSAVLGLGNIGPQAALPVMEGKCVLMKEFANVDAMPLVLSTQDADKIIETIKSVAPTFAAINLEDIKAPECFYIEERLQHELNIPVFHDDQHGTAIVVLAGLINAIKVTNKSMSEVKVIINGAGAAGIAIAKLLLAGGVGKLTLVDSQGVVKVSTASNPYKKTIATSSNYDESGSNLAEALVGSDIFIGVSQPGLLTESMIATMNQKSIIFALANPTPEIMPERALAAGAAVVATGRSDYPNQVNNVLAFPGVFKGLIGNNVSNITTDHMLSAANQLSEIIKNPTADEILPDPFNPGIADEIAKVIK